MPMTLKEWRRGIGITQRKAADLFGIDQAALCRWEKGDTAPSLPFAMKILDVTKGAVTLADLVRTSERG